MDRVFLALDNLEKEEILNFLSLYKSNIKYIKIGLEIFLEYGKDFIHQISNNYDFKIFLDLKLHDIPNTVASSIKSLEDLKIDFLTIHLSGGKSMAQAAIKARDKYLPKTKIIGVSVLTSLDDDECSEIFSNKANATFEKFLKIAIASKIDGIVCSGFELDLMPKNHSLITICPGIRLEDDDIADQKRVMTPKQAFNKGATFLVMGRSLRSNQALLTNNVFWSDIVK